MYKYLIRKFHQASKADCIQRQIQHFIIDFVLTGGGGQDLAYALKKKE